MTIRREAGFTIVEVLIAIIILSIGVLALASSAGGVTRMLSSAQRKTRSYSVIAGTLDSLRNRANSTTPKCTALVTSSSTTSRGYGSIFSRAWEVTTVGTGRRLVVRTSYRVGPRALADTMITEINC
jgi:prepilin-type N-terminal cleavage/methylation domain-containing protein